VWSIKGPDPSGKGYEIHFPLHHVNFSSSLLTPCNTFHLMYQTVGCRAITFEEGPESG
jgi:hypothetical protein